MAGLNDIVIKKRLLAAAVIVIFLVGLLPARPVFAGTPGPAVPDPILINDLREGLRGSSPASLAAIGSTVFFSGSDGLSGIELWKTVPPYNSIQQVADVCLGGCSSEPAYLTALGQTLFFSADDGKNGVELWRSEPPYTQQTTFLVADINPDGSSGPAEMTAIGDAVFFSADDGEHGQELWYTLPPYTDAALIEDIFPGGAGSSPHDLTPIGWMLFFIANDSSGTEVWRTDPPYSAASTSRQTRINSQGGDSLVNELTRMDLKLFFSADDGSSGRELYLLEPPYLESRRVTDVAATAASSDPTGLYVVDQTLFFTANIGFSGYELFKSESDYTPTKTVLVEDINEGFLGSLAQEKFVIGSTLFFSANDGSQGFELWKTEAGYKPSTTAIVEDIRRGAASSNPRAMTAVGTTLFFTANDGVYGPELWKSEPPYDDTTTEIIADIYRGSTGSNPHSTLIADRTLFFAATHAEYGEEMFRYGGYFGMPATGFAPGRVTRVKPQPADKAYQAMDDIRLEIPAIGVKTGVVGVPQSVDGWDLSWLTTQAGYLSGTAYPTWAGNTVLTAHVYLQDGTPGPFANLNRLKWGDRIRLNAFGQQYEYEVRSVESVNPEEIDAVFQHETQDWVTLVTCQGYDPNTNRYEKRLVVRAVLVKVK